MGSQQPSSSELYNLRWNSYFTNLTNVFANHQSQETLVDVTLSCESQFIKAHRLVLSACSTYFQKMFETHTASQLVIVLNDVKFKDLELIVQFMYKGEVKVADSEMQDFLSLGKMLHVKGLCSVELQNKQNIENNEKITNDKPIQPSLSENVNVDKKKNTLDIKVNSTRPKTGQSEQTNVEDTQSTAKKRKFSPVPENGTSIKKKNVKSSPNDNSQDISHIPRPPNAFMIFANQWRKKLAVEYPGDSNKDISVRLGNMWKSLSHETKEAFYEEARKADFEHKLKYPGYYYSPKEARNRKAIANITKAIQKTDSVVNIDNTELNDDELIEVRPEENGGDNIKRHSINSSSNSDL